ncbi:MAG: ECF-type sigma factor [Acidobacteriota bacterium]
MVHATTRPPQSAEPPDITELLLEWREGDDAALEALTPIVYEELYQVAEAYMRRESPAHLLQPTALVNEAYLRLVGLEVDWRGRKHFYAVAARLMRRILIDCARRRRAARRAPELTIALDEESVGAGAVVEREAHLVALDEALRDLESLDERKARVVELRFFAGMTIAETAEVLDVSPATVERDLKMARVWLAKTMRA